MELYDITDFYKKRESLIEEELEEIIISEAHSRRIELTDCDAEEELVKYWRKYIAQIDSIF